MTTTITSSAVEHVITNAWTGPAGNSPSVQYLDGVEVRRNLVTNPSFAVNMGNWSVWGGTTLTRDTTTFRSSPASGKFTKTSATAPTYFGAILSIPNVTPNTDYTISAWVNVPVDLTVPYRMHATEYAAADGLGGTALADTDALAAPIQFATGGWTQVSMTLTTGPSTQSIWFYVMDTPKDRATTIPVGETFYVDDAMIEVGVNAVGDYFDGSTQPSVTYGSSTPLLVDGWEESVETRNVVNNIVGGGVDITPYPADLRSGQYVAVFQDEEDAAALVQMHRQTARFTIQDTERPSIGMLYVANGTITRSLDDESREFWLVTIPYQEIDA